MRSPECSQSCPTVWVLGRIRQKQRMCHSLSQVGLKLEAFLPGNVAGRMYQIPDHKSSEGMEGEETLDSGSGR